MITIIRGPRASGKTTIAAGLKSVFESMDMTVLILDEVDPENKKAFVVDPRYRTYAGQHAFRRIEFDGNLVPLEPLYDHIIVVFKPGASGQVLYSRSETRGAFVVDTSSGYYDVDDIKNILGNKTLHERGV